MGEQRTEMRHRLGRQEVALFDLLLLPHDRAVEVLDDTITCTCHAALQAVSADVIEPQCTAQVTGKLHTSVHLVHVCTRSLQEQSRPHDTKVVPALQHNRSGWQH